MEKNKSFFDIIQKASETEFEFYSTSSSNGEIELNCKTTHKEPYLLSNKCLDTKFSQGSILVEVDQTTTLCPFQPSQVNSHILFGNLSNFAVFFKFTSKLSTIPVNVYHKPDFFLKPIKGERFSIQLINQAKEDFQLLAGTVIGHLILYPYFNQKWSKELKV